jgi:hypothetical protein
MRPRILRTRFPLPLGDGWIAPRNNIPGFYGGGYSTYQSSEMAVDARNTRLEMPSSSQVPHPNIMRRPTPMSDTSWVHDLRMFFEVQILGVII